MPRRIAVLRALQLGDLICAVPALRALRRAYPRAQVTLIGLPWAAWFARRYARYIDDFLEFPGWPGLPERPMDPAAVTRFLADLQARELDLAIQMHGSGPHVNDIVLLSGAREAAGFHPGHEAPPPRGRFVPWPERGHEIERCLALVDALGIPRDGTQLELPVDDTDRAELSAVPGVGPLAPGGYAVVHPGARFMSRRWPAERFASVADALAERGLAVVVTGTESEREWTRAVTAAMRTCPIDLTGRTSLGALAALVEQARVVVTNDTGMSHVATAVGTPSVVVTMGSDPARWAPLDAVRHRLVVKPVDCRPCMHDVCPIGHPCATAITDSEVLSEVDRLLEPPGAAQPAAASSLRIDDVTDRPLDVFTWHVHGNYLLYLSQVPHRLFIPVGDGRPFHGGRGRTFPFGDNVIEVPVDEVRRRRFDLVLYQHRDNWMDERWTLLSEAQRMLPAVYLEHDPPLEVPTDTRHWVDDPHVEMVHCTHYNRLMWDCGPNPTRVIEHGVVLMQEAEWTGEIERGLVVVNHLRSRGRRLGSDVFEAVRRQVPLDLVGMAAEELGGIGEVQPPELPRFAARYRFFFNPIRYTSLGLAVCEALMIGMPVIALATTEHTTAVENGVSGWVDTNVDRLVEKMRLLLADRARAAELSRGARAAARRRFAIDRFVREWCQTFNEVVARERTRWREAA